MKVNRKKRNTSMLLLILLLTVTIGFALLSTTLKINGIADIKGNKWDVRWDAESIAVTDGSVASSTPTISESDTKVSFDVELALPGNFYEFTIDAINAGTVDAMIEDIKTTITDGNGEPTTLPNYISFSVKYSDGTSVQQDDILAKRRNTTTPTRKKYKVRIEFDPEATTIPETDSRYNVTYEVKYQQSNSTISNTSSYENTGTGAYFDPVSTTKCDETTYGESSTCYRWDIINEQGSMITMQLDHSLFETEWADPKTYSTIQQTAGDIVNPKVGKLGDINNKAKVKKITEYYYDPSGECEECFNVDGPYTAMVALTNATQNWVRVPLISRFTHTADFWIASRVNVVDDFTTLTIRNGVYQAGDNEKTKITGVRARMITVDDIEAILESNGENLSDYQGEDHSSWDSDNMVYSLRRDNTEFYIYNSEKLSWLCNNDEPYWMMTQSYDIDSSWLISGATIRTWENTDAVRGVRPVITVPKKDVVIVN